MKLKIYSLLIFEVLSLGILLGCGKKEPVDISQVKEQARQSIRHEIQRVVKDPERAGRVSSIAEEYIPLFEKISQDQAAYLKELREVDAAYNSTLENYLAVSDGFRQKKKAYLLAFLDIRNRLKNEMSADEWESFSKLRTKMRTALGHAARNL